jgi:hypothetical protein
MDLVDAGSTLKQKFHMLETVSSVQHNPHFAGTDSAPHTSSSSLGVFDCRTRPDLTLDESISLNTSALGSTFFHDPQSHGPEAAEEEAKEIIHLSRFPSMGQDNVLPLRSSRSILQQISKETKQYLIDLFRIHYNSCIPIIPRLSLDVFMSQAIEDEDASSLITYLAILALGLLHANSERPDIIALRGAGARETLLHRELRLAVDEYVLQRCETGGIAALILLAELERYIGRAGTAGLYLREAYRLIKRLEPSQLDLSISDEDVLNRRAYMRAYEFIQKQWARFEPHGLGHKFEGQKDTTSSLQVGNSQSHLLRRDLNNPELPV